MDISMYAYVCKYIFMYVCMCINIYLSYSARIFYPCWNLTGNGSLKFARDIIIRILERCALALASGYSKANVFGMSSNSINNVTVVTIYHSLS